MWRNATLYDKHFILARTVDRFVRPDQRPSAFGQTVVPAMGAGAGTARGGTACLAFGCGQDAIGSLVDVLSATIIVCGASAWMAKYHDRMPVILAPANFDVWLNGTLGITALTCAPESTLHEWRVSPRLNRTGVGDDDPTIIEPVAAMV